MSGAKEIRLSPITAAEAGAIVRRVHYSGKVVPNSQLHLGVFFRGALEGAMQLGPPMDRRRMLGLVRGTAWNGMLELNRMAFSERLPRNSESRALAILFRVLRKQRPDIEWVVSFADGTRCGDGAIYRAAGFVLTAIKQNKNILQMPDGRIVTRKTLDHLVTADGRFGSARAREMGAVPLPGFQLRYVYFLNPAARERLSVPEIPFSRIAEIGARMYRGEAVEAVSETRPKHHGDAADDLSAEGGSIPTRSLQK
jgi:hypothetical protein